MHTENSSEASPPANAPAETPLTFLPHFPNEIILAIVGKLAFDDLKSARLLSKQWCFCASPSLFANISVSPNKEDLENFEAVTQHPQLRSHVRHLWYDGSEFLVQVSKAWYLHELWFQREGLFRKASAEDMRSSDPATNSWLQDAINNRMSLQATMTMFHNASFVNEGYRKYHEHAIYQQKCLQDGTFFDRLVQGLKQLDCLKVVHLGCTWTFDDGPLEPGKGSHLARNWNIFHCRPQCWEWGPRKTGIAWAAPWKNADLSAKAGDGAEHYRILVSALAKAQRRIRAFQTSLDLRCEIPPYVFDTDLKTRKASALQFYDDNVVAFSGVEELELCFANYGHLDTPKLFGNIAGLPALLRSLDHLKYLELRLPEFQYGFRYYYLYDQVFPKQMRWENMKKLMLFQLCMGATDFILLLLDAMPRLKSLAMGELGLSQGCWEGVFEALKQMHRLEVLELPTYTRFYHHGDQELVGDCLTKSAVYPQLTAYVKNGERHPCLQPGQPNSAAREYAIDLEPVLRQRLLDLDSSYWPAESTA